MTRIVRIRLTLEVPDDMEVQVNRDDGPDLFESGREIIMAGNPMQPVLSGPAPICPRHKKSKAGKGGYYCPTPISPVGVEPTEWCDWRVAG
jgi:hypothetical protein